MKNINEYEEIINGSREFDKASDNWTMYKAYEQNKVANNERLNISDVFGEEDVRQIAETVRRLGIAEFSISFETLSLIRLIAAFEELGIKFQGVIKVNSRYRAFNSDKFEVIPAFLMKVM